MPSYVVTDNNTGKKYKLTGDSPPTQEELSSMFSETPSTGTTEPKKPNILDTLASFAPGGGLEKRVLGAVGIDPMRALNGISSAAAGVISQPKQEDITVMGRTIPGPAVQAVKTAIPAFNIPAAVKGIQENKSVMEELPKAVGLDPTSPSGFVLGMAGELLTPDPLDLIAFGKGTKKLTEKLGTKVEDVGETLAVRSIKPSKTQLTNFTKATKKQLGDVLREEKLIGNVAENTVERIANVQSEFDDIAVRSGIKVNADNIVNAIDDKIAALSTGLNDIANKANIKALKDLRDQFVVEVDGLASYPHGHVFDVAELTDLRKSFDKNVPKSAWMQYLVGEAEKADITKRKAIQDIIVQSTEGLGDLKAMGKRLQSLFEVNKIAEMQQNLGKGSNIINLTNLLAAGVGLGVGDNPTEKIKNALVAAGFSTIANNPKVIGAISSVITKTGTKIKGNNAVPKLLELILRAGKEEMLYKSRTMNSNSSEEQTQINQELPMVQGL